MTEEQRQNLREAVVRRFAAMDTEKLAAFKEKCAANGRKSWAVRSAADKAAQIARINTPEVRKRASDANKAKHRVMTDEERAAYSARHKARWLHPTESVEAERRDRSERSKRMMAEMPVEKKRKMLEGLRLSCLAPVVAIPAARKGRPIPDGQQQSFPSMTAAAEWIKESRGVGGKISTIRHLICMVCCGRQATAYGHIWRYAEM